MAGDSLIRAFDLETLGLETHVSSILFLSFQLFSCLFKGVDSEAVQLRRLAKKRRK